MEGNERFHLPFVNETFETKVNIRFHLNFSISKTISTARKTSSQI